MASSDVLSETLSSITAIKLDEISTQRSDFEDAKSKLLKRVSNESNQSERVRLLISGIEDFPSMGQLKGNPSISLDNAKRFLEQARFDPSVSGKLQGVWQTKLEKELDIRSLKYEYASLYGELVEEWLSVAKETPGDSESSVDGSTYEQVGRKEMHEQREIWEDYVFKALITDGDEIDAYLQALFGSTKEIQGAYKVLVKATQDFEKLTMGKSVHFDDDTLTWVIQGLLRGDLVTDEKRKVLKDFLNNKVVLGEVADVLNMRMGSLDKWKWDAKGTPVEHRRKLNGRYRFYHDEDLLQSILLRYIGVQWSVHFKTALTSFRETQDVWKPSAKLVPSTDRKRREYFLGTTCHYRGVEQHREKHFADEVFLEQLSAEIDETRGGYDDDSEDLSDTRKSGAQITQTLLHTLATEIIMRRHLGEETTVVRTDYKWFGPSLPHSTMFAVLKFLGVSDKWVDFFRRALEAPMKFLEDGDDAPVRIRKRGTPISGPLSDVLGETVLFCLDFSFNQLTDGARLYRLHDDIWFWGDEKTCVKGWEVMKHFTKLAGLEFAEEKTGSVKISHDVDSKLSKPASSLPQGDVQWGFLKLDASSGRFLIDQKQVDTHVEELRLQLAACKSVFDWIQAWNVYGARFFTTNFGKPADCFGLAHVDMLLEAFSRIQASLFESTGGSVTSTLKQMISSRFGVKDLPEGYLYFPMSMGGLDLKSPFVNLYLVRDSVAAMPDIFMTLYDDQEEADYKRRKLTFENGQVDRPHSSVDRTSKFDSEEEDFMSMEEFTRYREHTSWTLVNAYKRLLEEPKQHQTKVTSDVSNFLENGDREGVSWAKLSPYHRWIVQLYASDMIARFGGLNVVEKGLLPIGMVSMFRESRFTWQG